MARLIPLIAVTNQSTVLQDSEVTNALPAFQNAVHYDWRPYWDIAGTLQFFPKGSTVPADAWLFAILDDSDQAGALGYHDVTAAGKPLAKIFAKTDQQYGASWQVTFTHELFEVLADPDICLAAQTSNTQFYGYEVGDPVEADQYAYGRKGADGSLIKISNFVYPSWFVPGEPGPFDHGHVLSKPLELTPGGYASIFVSGKGWTQVQERHGEEVPVALERDNPRFRDRSKKQRVAA